MLEKGEYADFIDGLVRWFDGPGARVPTMREAQQSLDMLRECEEDLQFWLTQVLETLFDLSDVIEQDLLERGGSLGRHGGVFDFRELEGDQWFGISTAVVLMDCLVTAGAKEVEAYGEPEDDHPSVLVAYWIGKPTMFQNVIEVWESGFTNHIQRLIDVSRGVI